ncbi:MAG: hypothetical protein VW683_17495 [Betaproteobacteria bacterium]
MSSLLTQLGQKVKAKLDNKLNTSGGLISGTLSISQSLQIGSYNGNSLPSIGTSGRIIYVTNGNSGSPCLAIDDGSTWKVIALGDTVSTAVHILTENSDTLTTEAGDVLVVDEP